MTSSHQQWHQVSSDYLEKVERALCHAPQQERQQILDELAFHMNKRFNDLEPGDQTWESMQQIISDLGPYDEYAALLDETGAAARSSGTRFFHSRIGRGFLVVLIGTLAGFGCLYASRLQKARHPIVIQTSPRNLIRTVDPDTTEISVTFSGPMKNFSWSWTGSGEHYPEITGDPKYDEGRSTCTLPVRLKPGQWYTVGVNSPSHNNFKSEDNVPAKPHVILFATADDSGAPGAIPEEYVEEMKRLNSK